MNNNRSPKRQPNILYKSFLITILASTAAHPASFMETTPANYTAGCVHRVFKDETKRIPNPYKDVYEFYKQPGVAFSEWAREPKDFTNPTSGIYYNAQYLVHIDPASGLLMTDDNQVFSTQTSKDMFVVSEQGHIYTRSKIGSDTFISYPTHQRKFPEESHFSHTSFGFPKVKAAGEWNVKNGGIIEMSNSTGHYSECTALFFAPHSVDINIWDFAKAYCETPHNGGRMFELRVRLALSEYPGQFFYHEILPIIKSPESKFNIDCKNFPHHQSTLK